MPNWVYNKVVVSGGTLETRTNFAKSVRVEDNPFSLNAVIPMPADEEDWYNWNVQNWGTKWDTSETSVTEEDEKIEYYFNTAWSPPMHAFDKIVAENPDLDFLIVFEEEQGWGAKCKSNDGKIELIEEWDIPSSHADHINRGGECYCDDNEATYPDCFSFRASKEADLPQRVKESAVPLGNGWTGTYEELIAAAKLL